MAFKKKPTLLAQGKPRTLDQLLAWEEKRMAQAEAALEALAAPTREEVSVADLLPRPERRPA